MGLPRILVLQYAHTSLVTVLARNSTDHHKYCTIEIHLGELWKKEWCLPSVWNCYFKCSLESQRETSNGHNFSEDFAPFSLDIRSMWLCQIEKLIYYHNSSANSHSSTVHFLKLRFVIWYLCHLGLIMTGFWRKNWNCMEDNNRYSLTDKSIIVFIEPVVCAGSSQIRHWKDGWTVVTQDDKRLPYFIF